MNVHTCFLAGACAVMLAACGAPSQETTAPAASIDANAPWHLVNEESRLTFVSIKAGDVAEVHTFNTMTGTVTADGGATIEVSLDSVDTAIELRDERMRAMLFETDSHPALTMSSRMALDAFSEMEEGDRKRIETDITVNLHGMEEVYFADLFVTRIGPDKVLVESASPVLVHAGDFDLDTGLEALREVAALPSISPAVPVSVSFVFEQ